MALTRTIEEYIENCRVEAEAEADNDELKR